MSDIHPFRKTSGFGPRGSEFHVGEDYAAPIGTPIPATSSGEVIYSGPSSGFHHAVTVKSVSPDGSIYYTIYGHVDGDTALRPGDKVSAGDPIGAIGAPHKDEGELTTGPHVHEEIVTQEKLNGGPPINTGTSGGVGIKTSQTELFQDPKTFTGWVDGAPFNTLTYAPIPIPKPRPDPVGQTTAPPVQSQNPGPRTSNDERDSPSQGSGADEASDNPDDAASPPSQPTLSYDPQQPLVPQLAAAMELGATAPSVTPTSMLFSDTSIAQQPLAPALLNAAVIAQTQPPGFFSDGLVDKQPSSSGYDPSRPLASALLTEASRLSGPSSPNALMGAPFVAPAQSIFDPVNYLEGLQDVLKPYYQPKDSAADAANAN